MKRSLITKALLVVVLLNTIIFLSCEKADELASDVIDELIPIKSLTEDLDKTSSNYNQIENLIINGKDASREIKIELPSSVAFSFDNKRYSLTNSAWTITKTSYSGSISKSMFTKKDAANLVKVVIQNNAPKVYVNNVLSSSGTTSGTGTGGTGTGGTGTGGGTTEIYNQTVTGNRKDRQYRTFDVPAGVKSMKVLTKETAPDATWNETDLFVNEGLTKPVSKDDPHTAGGWTAKAASLSNNRQRDSCVFVGPRQGKWTVMLYNYNSGYYFSNLVVTITK
ncbi:MAG: hypothetical protein JWQ40_4 [Segetibacter sp.]|jgi:hypothetical protein|nr:hypothetical protein [Segetibacter sp.]